MLNKKILDIMFTTPDFAPICSREKNPHWASSEKALLAIRKTLKHGGKYTPEIMRLSGYSQPSVHKAMRFLESNGEVISMIAGKGKSSYFELVS